jgi:hypothetical protein
MALQDADAVPPYYQLDGPVRFDSGPFHTTIDPRNLEYHVLQRADALVLRMIQDSWQERPFYFARSAGPYPRALGFGNNILTQGLAWKLFVPPATATRDTTFVQGDGWLDVRRTLTLWNDVFTGHKSTVAEGRWIDRPSASLPLLYVFTGAELADVLRATGRDDQARAVSALSTEVARTTGFGDIVRSLEQSFASTGNDSGGVSLNVPKTKSTEPTVVRKK